MPVVSALILALATPVVAQEIRGTVMDDRSDRPLEGAMLTAATLDDAVIATAQSDSAGRFLLTVPAGDSMRLTVERMDFLSLSSVPLLLGPGEPLELEIRLRPRPVDVGEIKAVARRQRSGFGWYLGEEDLTQNPPSSASWAMLRLPYVILAGRGIRVMGANSRPQAA